VPEVGDRVRVQSTKLGQVVREGVVTGVVGHFLQVQWSTGEKSTFMPGPGSVTVTSKVRGGKKAGPKKAPPTKKPVKKAAAKKATRKK